MLAARRSWLRWDRGRALCGLWLQVRPDEECFMDRGCSHSRAVTAAGTRGNSQCLTCLWQSEWEGRGASSLLEWQHRLASSQQICVGRGTHGRVVLGPGDGCGSTLPWSGSAETCRSAPRGGTAEDRSLPRCAVRWRCPFLAKNWAELETS